MHNFILTNPPITKESFNHTMQAREKKFDGKLATMVSTFNLNMGKCMEVATDTLKVQTSSTATTMGAMAMEFNSQPTPTCYTTIFGRRLLRPSNSQPLNLTPTNVQWRSTTSTLRPFGLLQSITKATTSTMNNSVGLKSAKEEARKLTNAQTSQNYKRATKM